MLSVNRVSSNYQNNIYNNKNHPSFQSRFIPNEALSEAFWYAKANCIGNNWEVTKGRTFAKIIESLIGDGKDDVIKVTTSKKGSTLIINNKRVNFYKMENNNSYLPNDGERVVYNFIDYFINRHNRVNRHQVSYDEMQAIKPYVSSLRETLSNEYIIEHPNIFKILQEHMKNITMNLNEQAVYTLEKFEAQIFNRHVPKIIP